MRAVVTRVKFASVSIAGEVHSEIKNGLLVLLGVHALDTEKDADKIADRICGLRIFEDESGKMNISPEKALAELMIISQFTLYADCKSRRPGFSLAARPDIAVPLYNRVIDICKSHGFIVKTGVFGADMKVLSLNDGPVTIILDSFDL